MKSRRRRRPQHALALAVLTAGALVAGVFLPGPSHPIPHAAIGGRDVDPVPQVVSWVPIPDKLIALTFDAGSDAGHTLAILDILREESVTATFFLTGAWLDNCPDLAREVAGRGHDLGNHTQSHPYLTRLTDEEIAEELRVTEEKALSVLGRTLKPYFRPPFGDHNPRVAYAAAMAGYTYVVMWTVDSLDWKMISPEELTQRVVSGSRSGGIVLMHVGSQTRTPEALPGIIRHLKQEGYRLVGLSELLQAWPDDAVLHTVASGETLSAIARQYGLTVANIMTANGLTDPDRVRAGSALIIPVGRRVYEGGKAPGQTDPDRDTASKEPGEGAAVGGGDDRSERQGFLDRLRSRLHEAWVRVREAAVVIWYLFVGR